MRSDDAPSDSNRAAERGSVTERSVLRCAASGPKTAALPDAIAVEEPLEIRIASDTFVTIMRTPGEDHFLAAGFLFSEGIIQGLGDLGRIAHCGRPSDPGYGNLIDIAPGPGTVLAPELSGGARRHTLLSSACGICGRERIDDLTSRLGRITHDISIDASQISVSIQQLAARQTGFARTGAVHGALACDADGRELAVSEDVGRHNAVDKVIGKLLFANQLGSAALLAVSGRTSFEIVQKAATARIPVLISVSAPTSLAVDLATALHVTLIGFARSGDFNVYAHPERIRWR
jgi:FdhD protein